MTVTFLGTGTSQGVPVIACNCEVCSSENPKDKRLRSSILISEGENHVVIDTGPDFRQQMLREGLKTLNAVVFTHEHKDHIAGLDDVRAFNYFTGIAMRVFCNDAVEKAIRREFYYAFTEEKYPGVPVLHFHNIQMHSFDVDGIPFVPIAVKHMEMNVLGFRVGDFTYITDANFISDKEMEKVYGSKILVLNALRKQKHPSHFNLEEALELIKVIKPEKAFLTHISHQLGTHAEVSANLPANVFLSYDGLKLEI
ncbi:MAG: MBL fold metallo-hydrolase [Flavobacteriales bacterium]|nr:MBL fold metallo-hydrolase [Flavobacteriales bacterium]